MTHKADILSDRDIFLNVDEYGDTATHVATGLQFPVILDSADDPIAGQICQILGTPFAITAKSEEFDGMELGEEITIDSVIYRLATYPRRDGSGFSIAGLAERTEETLS